MEKANDVQLQLQQKDQQLVAKDVEIAEKDKEISNLLKIERGQGEASQPSHKKPRFT